MDLRNHTWFPAKSFQGLTPEGEGFHVFVLRQTLLLQDDGLAYSPQQTPLCSVDTFEGVPNRSSVLSESDLCHAKPWCDVLLRATAHAPGGNPVRSFPVHLKLWRREDPSHLLIHKTLLVCGPNRFQRRNLFVRWFWLTLKVGSLGLIHRNPWRRTRPERILSLPVRYEYAYGGEAKVMLKDPASKRVPKAFWLPGITQKVLKGARSEPEMDAPLAWSVHEANPIGKGYGPAWFLKSTRTHWIPAPQIESVDSKVSARDFLHLSKGMNRPAIIPQGFGILAKGWIPRRFLVGTIDEAWIQGGAPLPADFNFAIWNGAPLDQQVPHLRGDEILECTNLCAETLPGARRGPDGSTHLRLTLPGHRPYLVARYRSGVLNAIPLLLDTVNLDLERGTLSLVWRKALPLEPEIRVVEVRMDPPSIPALKEGTHV